MRNRVYTVSEIVKTLKNKLDLDPGLQKIIVQGEKTNDR